MTHLKKVTAGLLTPALMVLGASGLAAQETPGAAMAEQSLRPYWHVFIAYAIAIALVLAWVISIGKRLKDVEKRLGQ